MMTSIQLSPVEIEIQIEELEGRIAPQSDAGFLEQIKPTAS